MWASFLNAPQHFSSKWPRTIISQEPLFWSSNFGTSPLILETASHVSLLLHLSLVPLSLFSITQLDLAEVLEIKITQNKLHESDIKLHNIHPTPPSPLAQRTVLPIFGPSRCYFRPTYCSLDHEFPWKRHLKFLGLCLVFFLPRVIHSAMSNSCLSPSFRNPFTLGEKLVTLSMQCLLLRARGSTPVAKQRHQTALTRSPRQTEVPKVAIR